ncbi:hypothetical protein [Xanthomonas fragariae]|uniref:hypothetical protein n=1 Tax=Xanthomonas fragariae TaxID=48664 RepID=UPI0022AB1F0F|nr:hypothetical protein [Xanthomonas fragariae]WAT13827.1 hypothetical protein OZ429_11770 [Xanthomonas fragariae]
MIIEGWIGSAPTRWKASSSAGQMRESWRCSAAIPALHQLDKIQQQAVFFIMKRSEKMVRPKSSNRRTHAQSTYQSLPEQPTGWPASPGGAPAGISSSSAPSGVLGELTARPTKLRRTEASAVRLVPASGAHPAPNGTSMPFASSALPYGDLPPNSHVHHHPLWRTDAPELQGATAQQRVFEDAAVHEEPRAAANRPSTLPRGPTPFAELSGNIRDGTVLSGSKTPYPTDTALIARFVDGAEKGDSNFTTTRIYSQALIRFSDWLRQQNKGSVQERLFKDKEALEQDASNFQQGYKSNYLTSGLNQLRTMAVATDGTVKLRGYPRHQAPDEDTQLINAALSAKPQQASALRAFSAWLHAQGKKGLCETGRLHSQTLMDDAKAFVKTGMASSSRSVSALKHLEAFYCAGATDIVARLKRRDIHEVDHQLSEQFKAAFSASGLDNQYADGRSYGRMLSERLMRFSAWLKKNQKGPMASRLHDQTLNDDLKLFTYDKSPNYRNCMKHMLTQVRTMLPPDVQLPDLGSRAEPAEPSYSYMFPLTPEGGWPQAAEGVWIPDTPEQEVTGPAWPAQPAASSPPLEFDWGGALHQTDVLLQGHQNLSHLSQTHPSNWDLDNFSDQFTGHSLSAQPGASISNIPFDWQAMHPAATEPHHSTAMPQASILTLDENHTELDWNDGERRVPE